MSLPASQLTAGVKILNGYPVDYRYLDPETDQPYDSVSSANSAIISGVRYVGLTININNTEYWYKDGITDSDLIPKELGSSGGGTHSGDVSIISYPNIGSMIASQTDLPQTDKHIIHVLDASGDSNINFETGETRKQALYRLKNNTHSGSIDDYYLLSAPYKVDVFKSNITVAIDDVNKSVGKYTSGQVILCEGMTFEQFARDISIENLPPTASINFSPSILEYNTTNISNNVNLSNVIRNDGASVASFGLKYRKGASGPYTDVPQNDLPANGIGTWTFQTTNPQFNSVAYEFVYDVVDTMGGTVSVSKQLTFKAYSTPNVSLTVGDSANDVKPLRETGDIHSIITVSSSTRSPLVGLIGHDISYRKDGGSWTSFDTGTHANASSISLNPDHNDPALDDAERLRYRFSVRDELSGLSTARTSNEIEIKFQNYIFFGRIDVPFPGATGSTYSITDGSSIRSFAFDEIKGISNGTSKVFTGEVGVGNESTFEYRVEAGYNNFAVLMPEEYVITEVMDIDYNAQSTGAYVIHKEQGATVSYSYNDAGGVVKNYNMYRVVLGTPYTGVSPLHIVTFERVS